MLPTPPKERHKVEPHQRKLAENDRRRSRDAAAAIAQRFKDEALLAQQSSAIISAVRGLQKQYPNWSMQDYINTAWRDIRPNRTSNTTNATTLTTNESSVYLVANHNRRW